MPDRRHFLPYREAAQEERLAYLQKLQDRAKWKAWREAWGKMALVILFLLCAFAWAIGYAVIKGAKP